MLDNYQDLLDELLSTPKIVREALGASPSADIVRLISAMQARDRLVLARTQRIKEQTDPHLKELPDLDALSDEDAGDPADLAASFDTARGDLVSLLMNLTLRDWERTATTDAGDVITLSEEVEAHVDADEAMRARLQELAGA